MARATASGAISALVVVLLALIFLGPPSSLAPAGATPLASTGSGGHVLSPGGMTVPPAGVDAVPSAVPAVALGSLSGTLTAGPNAATTSSDVLETPAPAIPTTQPSTFVVASNLVCPSSCTPLLNITAPTGPWALILLNFTGSVQPEVYDSSYHATVDGVPVFFGTSPEQYTWTVLKDLTEYSALFYKTAQFQFDFGQATVGGHFDLSVSVSFYPVPSGTPAPTVPTEIVPLWPFTGVSVTRPAASVLATIPEDIQNATLELYSYGFSGGKTADEFWYDGTPAFRAISVSVDGSPLVTTQPFEYINTGGIDLFLWDPVTGAYTANDLPYQVDVTAALGLIEGTHTLNASVFGVATGSDWFVAGELLLYTNASVTGATIASDPTPQVTFSNGSSGGAQTESVTRSYSYESNIDYVSGNELASSWTNETFTAAFSNGAHPNESVGVVGAHTTVQETDRAPWGSDWVNASSTPSVSLSSGQDLVISSTTGGGYPEYGNVTYEVYSLIQGWAQSRTDTAVDSHGVRTVRAQASDDVVQANGSYVAEEKLISPAAAQLVQIDTFWSNTSKQYTSSETLGPLTATYNHTVTSELTPADLSTSLAAVTDNSVQYLRSGRTSRSPPRDRRGPSEHVLGAGDRIWGAVHLCVVRSPDRLHPDATRAYGELPGVRPQHLRRLGHGGRGLGNLGARRRGCLDRHGRPPGHGPRQPCRIRPRGHHEPQRHRGRGSGPDPV